MLLKLGATNDGRPDTHVGNVTSFGLQHSAGAPAFAAAWGGRDADGIAALFEAYAEFVNVTSLIRLAANPSL